MEGRVNLYFGGCMSYHHANNEYHKAIDWRIQLAQKLLNCNSELCYRHFDWFDPTVNFEDNVKTANDKTVIQQNNYYLNKTDILIANLEDLDKSPGTLYEIFYYGIQNKPIIVFGNSELIHSPHILGCISVLVDDLDDVVDYLMAYYVQ